jgi:DNA replicative helicase MCM subunit Mcm2 (Cdc46/Mcm family)
MKIMSEEVTYTDSAMRDRIRETIENDKETFNVISKLHENSKVYVNVGDPLWVDYYLSDSGKFRDEYLKAVYLILTEIYPDIEVGATFKNLSIEFTTSDTILLHDINPIEHENSPIAFNCEIIAGDSWMTYIKSATFVCPKCFNEYNMKADFDKSLLTVYCSTDGCKKAKCELDKKRMITGYVQTVVIQESLEESKHNNPISFEAKIYDEHVGTAFPGQKKKMTGIFHSKINPKENEHSIFIEITSMIDIESTEPLIPTKEELEKYYEDSTKSDFCEKLIDSYAPSIFANQQYRDMKLAILLQLVGGKKGKRRSDINQILVGDPSMAKSVMLQFAESITQKSLYTSGKGSTSAGLTIGIVTLDSGRKVAMAGVLPICSGGFAMIDEFDKMNTNDRSAIHEAMEQQTTSIAKAGIIMSLPTKTSILAAANPIGGKYDSESSLADNLNLTATILSRFDLIWLIVDKVDEKFDELKANHIINDFLDEEENTSKIYLNVEQLTAYLNHARGLTPTISEELRVKAKELYHSLRRASKSNDALAVGTRQLEGIMRLAYAHAKLMLKDEVDANDLKIVTNLLKSSYQSLNVDLDSGESMQSQFVTKKDGKKVAMSKCWRMSENSMGLVKSKDFVEKLVDTGLFSEHQAQEAFANMEKECQIKMQGGGLWKKTSGLL